MRRAADKTVCLPQDGIALEGRPIGKHITFYKQWFFKEKCGKRFKRLPRKRYVFFVDDFFVRHGDEADCVYWDKRIDKFVLDIDSCEGLLDYGNCCSFKTLSKEILSWNLPAGIYVRIWGDLNVVALIKE